MIKLRASADVIRARLAAREMVREAGLGVMDQTRFATAVSELGRCALLNEPPSSCELTDESDARVHRLQARFSQDGEAQACAAQSFTAQSFTAQAVTTQAPEVRQLVDVYTVDRSAAGLQITVQIVRPRKPAP